MTALNMETVQDYIIFKLSPLMPDAEFTPMGEGVWVQYRERWIHITAEFREGEMHLHNIDWTIERGLEAGFDLIGGEHHEEPAFRVRGFKFGVLPKTIQWIKTGSHYNFI